MRTYRIVLGLALLAPLVAAPAAAQTATQTVNFEVQAINQISVSGNPGTLTVSSATAGSAPNSATDATTSWAVTTNESPRKITASIDVAMPTGLTLSLAVAPPPGATGAGSTALGTVAVDVVTAISKLEASGLGLTYTLQATSAAGTVASTSRTVTLTITS